MPAMISICVFCGAKHGSRASYAAAASQLGAILAARGISLVYGGASIGLMGVLADAVLADGGRVLGVIPNFLVAREIGHSNLTDLVVVESMHERKMLMATNADAFIALPGGLGTLEELFEVLTWAQLGLHNKPIGLLNVDGYYDKLLAFLDQMVDEALLKAEHRTMLLVDGDPEALLDRLATHVPPAMKR